MALNRSSSLFPKVLLPVVHDCNCVSAKPAALLAAGNRQVSLLGIVSLEAGESVSAGAVLVDHWFAENSYAADEFKELDYLLDMKRGQDYGVEFGLVVDIFEHYRLQALAQVDLQERIPITATF